MQRDYSDHFSALDNDLHFNEILDTLYIAIERINQLSRATLDELRRQHNLTQRGLHILGRVIVGDDTPSDLVMHFVLPASTVTFEINKLVSAGLLVRSQGEFDRRGTKLIATMEGLTVHREVIKRITALMMPRFEKVPRAKLRAFLQVLGNVSR